MPRRRKSETEPSVSKMAAPASAGPAKRPRAAHVRAAATKRRTRKETAVKPPAAPQAPKIAHEEIARRAYFYWKARGCPVGSPEEDWYRAEQELQTRIASAIGIAAGQA